MLEAGTDHYVGHATFAADDAVVRCDAIEICPSHKRKGIATAFMITPNRFLKHSNNRRICGAPKRGSSGKIGRRPWPPSRYGNHAACSSWSVGRRRRPCLEPGNRSPRSQFKQRRQYLIRRSWRINVLRYCAQAVDKGGQRRTPRSCDVSQIARDQRAALGHRTIA